MQWWKLTKFSPDPPQFQSELADHSPEQYTVPDKFRGQNSQNQRERQRKEEFQASVKSLGTVTVWARITAKSITERSAMLMCRSVTEAERGSPWKSDLQPNESRGRLADEMIAKHPAMQ